jgi:transposase
MTTTFNMPVTLDIEGLEIIDVKINREGHYEVYVESTVEGCTCHECCKHITKPHGKDRLKRIKHLYRRGRETYLIVRLPRFQCVDCYGKPTTTQQVAWHERNSPNTIPFEKHILLGLMGGTVEDVSQRFGLGYETVMGSDVATVYLTLDICFNGYFWIFQTGKYMLYKSNSYKFRDLCFTIKLLRATQITREPKIFLK